MLLSILVPTLQERRAVWASLRARLHAQMDAARVADKVELLELCDNREKTLGMKRNVLLAQARGEFSVFVDDDDRVDEQYVETIVRALEEHPEVDCLGIMGRVYFRGAHPHRFIYSARYDHYFSRGGVYYRPAYILNPMRRTLALTFAFEDVSMNEDQDWAMRMARAGVLRREVMLERELYHYYSRRRYAIQRAIDVTEPLRHPLGLKWANRLRLKRFFKL
jgi:glycosyltransferase involved in cell wall biosynthesis